MSQFEGIYQPKMGTGYTLADEIALQSVGVDILHFKCDTCVNHSGGCKCDANVFIAFEGANMTGCSFYRYGHKCPHCGRVS